MKKYFVIIVFTFPYLSFSQYFTIHTHKETWKRNNFERVFKFPLIVNRKYPDITAKINATLQKEYLDTLIIPGKIGFFKKTYPFFTENNGVYDDSYEIIRNDSLILTLFFRGESCGGSCSFFELYYNFNSQTGDLIQVKNLYTHKGLIFADIALNHARIKNIKDYIKKLKIEKLKAKKLEDKVRIKEQIELYQDCLTFKTNATPYKYKSMKDTSFISSYDEIYFKSNSLVQTNGGCNSRNGLDDLGRISIELPINTISDCIRSKHLSALNIKREEIKKQSIFSGSLNGNIQIVMLISTYIDNKMRGTYFYKSQGVPIELKIETQSDTLIMRELINENLSKSYFKITKTQDGFSGKWTDLFQNKELDVILKEDDGLIHFK